MSVPRFRSLPADVNDALARVVLELQGPWAAPTPGPVEVTFPVADVPRQVRHGLGAVPAGFLVVLATDAVYAVTPELWTEDLALLRSPVANTFARLWFFQLRQTPEVV